MLVDLNYESDGSDGSYEYEDEEVTHVKMDEDKDTVESDIINIDINQITCYHTYNGTPIQIKIFNEVFNGLSFKVSGTPSPSQIYEVCRILTVGFNLHCQIWSEFYANPHAVVANYFNDVKVGECVCCGSFVSCCVSCRGAWTDDKLYPSLSSEYMLSPLCVEIMMNIIYWALFEDQDTARILENFSPVPNFIKTNEGVFSPGHMKILKLMFDSFMGIDAIADTCSVYGKYRMRKSFYELDVNYGHMHDTFEWLLSTTYSRLLQVPDEELATVHAKWHMPKPSSPKVRHVILRLETQFQHYDHTGETATPVFHGTHPHCVSSIIRNGLIINSNTTRQINGSMYGPGIYSSTTFDTGYKYCPRLPPTKAWEQSTINIQKCLFLCDFYDGDASHGDFRIARRVEDIIIRYLLIEIKDDN